MAVTCHSPAHAWRQTPPCNGFSTYAVNEAQVTHYQRFSVYRAATRCLWTQCVFLLSVLCVQFVRGFSLQLCRQHRLNYIESQTFSALNRVTESTAAVQSGVLTHQVLIFFHAWTKNSLHPTFQPSSFIQFMYVTDFHAPSHLNCVSPVVLEMTGTHSSALKSGNRNVKVYC